MWVGRAITWILLSFDILRAIYDSWAQNISHVNTNLRNGLRKGADYSTNVWDHSWNIAVLTLTGCLKLVKEYLGSNYFGDWRAPSTSVRYFAVCAVQQDNWTPNPTVDRHKRNNWAILHALSLIQVICIWTTPRCKHALCPCTTHGPHRSFYLFLDENLESWKMNKPRYTVIRLVKCDAKLWGYVASAGAHSSATGLRRERRAFFLMNIHT